MGLFTKSSSNAPILPNLDGLSEEARRLALENAAEAASLIAPPPAALAAALANAGSRPAAAPQQTEHHAKSIRYRVDSQSTDLGIPGAYCRTNPSGARMPDIATGVRVSNLEGGLPGGRRGRSGRCNRQERTELP